MLENFKNHLKTYLTEDQAEELIKSFSNDDKHAALLNTRKMSDEKFISLFPHVIPHPIVPHAYIYNKNEYELGKTIYHELGCFYLQEPSAMIVSHILSPKAGEIILDLCAAPGGKTIQASLLMQNRGLIISNDLAKDRCRALHDNTTRLGCGNIIITNNDFSFIYQNYKETFDRIILDAPCSGSGMFRKDDKMMDDWSENKVFKFSMIQMSLIDYSYQMLKPGGTLVYSTCSYSYQEDEEVIKHLLSTTDAEIININNSPLFFESKDKLGIHLLPSVFPGEGHYICLIKKPGTRKNNENKVINPFIKLLPEEIKEYSTSKFNDVIFALPQTIKYKGLNIYHYGVRVGELFKDKIVYAYDLARHLSNYKQIIELNDDEVQKYLLGEEINKNNPYQGNVLLTYQNIPVDFSKTNGITLKNHYPKYLRKKVTLR